MLEMNPLLIMDSYKACHQRMYPKGLTQLTSYLTPRKNMIEDYDRMVVFGVQAFVKELKESFDTNFFNHSLSELEDSYNKYMNVQLGQGNFEWERVKKLHQLGYLPLKISALPEGSYVNMGIPIVEITNTHPNFAWLTQWVECWMQAEVWKSCNFATIGHIYHKLFEKWYRKNTENADPYLAASDFGMRGMSCLEEAAKCSAAWLLSFNKTSTIPALPWLDKYYYADVSLNRIGIGGVSTEHSVMASNFAIDHDEISFLRRMLTELYPKTSFSVVSDTYDYWHLVKEILPELKEEIFNHQGKMLIRPDSGDQVSTVVETVQELWNIFGGTENRLGYKVLDSHIGVILGDGCTLKVVNSILEKLDRMKFAANNVNFGIGAFCFSAIFNDGRLVVNTRDLFGMALKSTHGVVNGEFIKIFKDPKTDTEHLKKSHQGLCEVYQLSTKEYGVIDGIEKLDFDIFDRIANQIKEKYQSDISYSLPMRPIFMDGKLTNTQYFMEIRERLESEDQ